jgi:hypothetical protein
MKYTIFGATYDCGAYGAGNYETSACSASSTGGSSGNNGVLTNTGFDILLIATIAAALIFTALVVRFWRRPAKKKDLTNGPTS